MNKSKIIYLAFTSITLLMSLIQWWFLVPSAIGTIAYGVLCRSNSKKRDHELLAFAKEFREMNHKDGSAQRCHGRQKATRHQKS